MYLIRIHSRHRRRPGHHLNCRRFYLMSKPSVLMWIHTLSTSIGRQDDNVTSVFDHTQYLHLVSLWSNFKSPYLRIGGPIDIWLLSLSLSSLLLLLLLLLFFLIVVVVCCCSSYYCYHYYHYHFCYHHHYCYYYKYYNHYYNYNYHYYFYHYYSCWFNITASSPGGQWIN